MVYFGFVQSKVMVNRIYIVTLIILFFYQWEEHLYGLTY